MNFRTLQAMGRAALFASETPLTHKVRGGARALAAPGMAAVDPPDEQETLICLLV
jgi:hypothetical protein